MFIGTKTNVRLQLNKIALKPPNENNKEMYFIEIIKPVTKQQYHPNFNNIGYAQKQLMHVALQLYRFLDFCCFHLLLGKDVIVDQESRRKWVYEAHASAKLYNKTWPWFGDILKPIRWYWLMRT